MASLGTAVFDFALYAYPFYQTNQLNVSTELREEDIPNLSHWLRFWTVVAGLSVVEDIGINSLPGYYFLKGALILGLYSDVHSNFINSVALRKLFLKYNETSDKAIDWWNTNGQPQLVKMDDQSGGWLSTIKNKATSYLWWSRPHQE